MQYEVIARAANVPGGCVLKLSEDQARRRRPFLEKAKDGWLVTAASVAFKQGETFELVSGHIDLKSGELRAIGRPSPAEAKEKKRAAARRAGAARRAAQAAKGEGRKPGRTGGAKAPASVAGAGDNPKGGLNLGGGDDGRERD